MTNQGPRTTHDVVGDRHHQHREWMAERVGWTLMGMLVLAGLAGLLGSGPLSRARIRSPSTAVVVDYQQFERHGARGVLRVHVARPSGASLRVWLGREFRDAVRMDIVDPEPDKVELTPDRVIFVFTRADSGAPADLIFHFEPTRMGRVLARLGIEGHPEEAVTFRQFYYP